MRIAFAEVQTKPYSPFTHCNEGEPYGLELIAGVAVKAGNEARIFQQQESDENFIRRIKGFDPHVLAFSCMAYNFEKVAEFARRYKQQSPAAKVIVGGPHVSSCPESLESSLKERTVDIGIRGEGELPFLAWLNNEEPENVGGAVYFDGSKLQKNPLQKRIRELDTISFALRDSSILSKNKVGRIMYPVLSHQSSPAIVAYSRGCPFSCSFCDSKTTWGNSISWRSVDNVVDEIIDLEKRFGTNTIFFSDLTFNANTGKVEELCDGLIARGTSHRIKWYALVRAATPDGAKALLSGNILRKMASAGCTKLAYGFEGVLPDVQENYSKIISSDMMAQLVEAGHLEGILSKGSIIIGDPKQAKMEISETPKVLKKIGFDEIRISFLTPFPGSLLYDQAKQNGQLLTENLSDYTTDVPVLKCEGLSSGELVQGRQSIAREYYTSTEYQNIIECQIERFPHLRESYEEHIRFLKDNGVV